MWVCGLCLLWNSVYSWGIELILSICCDVLSHSGVREPHISFFPPLHQDFHLVWNENVFGVVQCNWFLLFFSFPHISSTMCYPRLLGLSCVSPLCFLVSFFIVFICKLIFIYNLYIQSLSVVCLNVLIINYASVPTILCSSLWPWITVSFFVTTECVSYSIYVCGSMPWWSFSHLFKLIH